MDNFNVEVKKSFTVRPQQVEDILCTAIEGGIGYWACLGERRYPESGVWYKQWQDTDADDWVPNYISVIMSQGGSIQILDAEDENSVLGTLNLEAIQRGLEIMADRYPRYFREFVEEDYDANTADVFVQLCVLGDIVYG